MRKWVRYMFVVVAAAALYTGWVFLDRHWRDEEYRRRMESMKGPAIPPPDYGTTVKILQFYAYPGIIARGDKSLLCYGVVNATSVAIEPDAVQVSPSLNRCLEIRPVRRTRYTLTAEGPSGPATQSLVVEVEPPER